MRNPFANKVFSVSDAVSLTNELVGEIKILIEGEVCELSNSSAYKALYFSLKDDEAKISCLMWRNIYDSLDIEIKEGSKIRAFGHFSVYQKKGTLSFAVSKIEQVGEGKLREQVNKLANALREEGLFDESSKKEIPPAPARVGLITSGSGAAINDVIKTLKTSPIPLEVFVCSVKVEGDSAVTEIKNALKALDEQKLDAILLVRGGGAYEDFMPFNDESLARLIFSLDTPVITGIGHTNDSCIADFVADCNKGTPTAAAEVIVRALEVIYSEFLSLQSRLNNSADRNIEMLNCRVDTLRERLLRYSPENSLRNLTLELDSLVARMLRLKSEIPNKFGGRITSLATRLDDLSPLSALSRGYSYVIDKNSNVVRGVSSVSVGNKIEVHLSDGILMCNVEEISEK